MVALKLHRGRRRGRVPTEVPPLTLNAVEQDQLARLELMDAELDRIHSRPATSGEERVMAVIGVLGSLGRTLDLTTLLLSHDLLQRARRPGKRRSQDPPAHFRMAVQNAMTAEALRVMRAHAISKLTVDSLDLAIGAAFLYGMTCGERSPDDIERALSKAGAMTIYRDYEADEWLQRVRRRKGSRSKASVIAEIAREQYAKARGVDPEAALDGDPEIDPEALERAKENIKKAVARAEKRAEKRAERKK